ncbi:hypothetical protein TcasGA2_TC033494 [Tribolium castaneum]|uniref:Uncharacterized protein n=1 Tax=Tribolium castaneum TaxID=7070 RepID=A0A139WDK9_TRICA|nr:hypothetical protein TcasGA2_TC033494 [Tribolium castaneum]
MVRDTGIFVLFLSISGAMLGVSLMMFFYVIEDTPTFVNVRLCALIFAATITGMLYVIQGQNTEDISEECFQTLTEMGWYYWNEENKRIYQLLFINSCEPFSIRFSENMAVNYKLGIELAKAVYSMMSFMTGAMLGISLMMLFYVVEDTPTFVNVRLCGLIFAATITGMLYVIQGQNIEDISVELFETVTQMDWHYWNEENKRIYQIMFLNTF